VNFDFIPDLSGKVAVVTGANSGIGYWTALHLASRGAHVVVGCRSATRADSAVDAITAASPGSSLEVVSIDLGSLASVREAAASISRRHPRIDILCNNAGIALMPRAHTVDGFESHFGTNYLGHFALTGLLLDRITDGPGARVVHAGSLAHRIGTLDIADPNFERRRYSRWSAYAQSKTAVVSFALELARRLQASGTDAISVGAHPGWSGTGIAQVRRGRRSRPLEAVKRWLNATVLNAPELAAAPTLSAATMRGVENASYFGPSDWMELKGLPGPARVGDAASDPELARRLWTLSEKLTGVSFLG
jgi:NAD(P)-dependent dehydrogenase (short-subunit alcohol dehydrogenase family)